MRGRNFFVDSHRGFSFGKEVKQYISSLVKVQNPSSSTAVQLQRLNQMVRSPSTKRQSPLATPRITRHKPVDSSSRATATTASYSGVTQMNTTSFSSPTTSYSSSTTTHEISITVERRLVAVETRLDVQQQQQDEMNTKLDSLDEIAQESNVMLKQMMADMNITKGGRGAKRDKPSGNEADDQDATMGTPRQFP